MQISDGPHHEQTLEYSIVLTNLSPGLTYLFKVWYIASNVYLNHETISIIHSTSAKDPVLTLLSFSPCYVQVSAAPSPIHSPSTFHSCCLFNAFLYFHVCGVCTTVPFIILRYVYKRRKICEISVSNRQTSMKASCIFLHVHRSVPEHR